MQAEQYIYLIVFILWLIAVIHGASSLWDGVVFYRYVKRAITEAPRLRTPAGQFSYQPKAVVILPCCGVDEKLEQTVRALARQSYDDYEVVFTFESVHDPAFTAIKDWTGDWQTPRASMAVAGLAENRAQKVHNLLAAVKAVSEDREAIVFLDSDAVPPDDWLGHMVAPLQDDSVGVATGYRWYVATGGLAAGLRSAWNAATVSLLADEKLNVCWGGSTAIRRDRFDALNVAGYWDRALSDDYQMTRAVRDAGLRIRFVPQALIPNTDRTTFRQFWHFARRQVIITRICGPELWRSGFLLCANFVVGGSAVAILFGLGLLGWFGTRTTMYLALVGWVAVAILAGAKPVLRQLGLRRVMKPPNLTWRDFCWDVGGTLGFAGWLHLGLIFSSLRTRRIVWRNTEYEMISPSETRVLRRVEQE